MDLLEQAKQIGWYHTLELTPEFTTDGMFDMRPHVSEYGLPERLDGQRVLEIGTWDGFWAFELERRGAQVVALDIEDEADLDYPPRRRPKAFPEQHRGEGFRIAKELRGSSAERVVCNLYDATPENLGTFDLVFCGSVLIHMRDQLLALERIANLSHDRFISAEEYDRRLSLYPGAASRYRADRDAAIVFWLPNKRAWKRMIWSAGFDEVKATRTFGMKADWQGKQFTVPHVVHHARKRA